MVTERTNNPTYEVGTSNDEDHFLTNMQETGETTGMNEKEPLKATTKYFVSLWQP